MSDLGPEVTDVPLPGGESLFVPAAHPPIEQKLSPKGIAGIQGKTAETPEPPQNSMTLEDKALLQTPSEAVSPKAISFIQGKTG